MRLHGILACVLAIAPLGTFRAAGTVPEPAAIEGLRRDSGARLSDRTLLLGIQVDREQARLVAYTVKARPFFRPAGEPDPPRPYDPLEVLQLELRLIGADGGEHLQRFTTGPFCFDHRPGPLFG